MTQEAKVKAILMSAVVLGLLLMPSPARAQRHYEITPFIGYTTAGDIGNIAPEIAQLQIAGGFTWGAQFGVFFGPNLGVELSWAQQETGLRLSTTAGSATPFDIKAGKLHGNFIYQFAKENARVRPYVLAGLGATFFRSAELRSETKLSWAIGGGAKMFLQEHIGIKIQAKYNPTRLGDESAGNFCDPFGFCQGTLNQFELGGGLIFRF
jgi:opacity protein-like surface antigen